MRQATYREVLTASEQNHGISDPLHPSQRALQAPPRSTVLQSLLLERRLRRIPRQESFARAPSCAWASPTREDTARGLGVERHGILGAVVHQAGCVQWFALKRIQARQSGQSHRASSKSGSADTCLYDYDPLMGPDNVTRHISFA